MDTPLVGHRCRLERLRRSQMRNECGCCVCRFGRMLGSRVGGHCLPRDPEVRRCWGLTARDPCLLSPHVAVTPLRPVSRSPQRATGLKHRQDAERGGASPRRGVKRAQRTRNHATASPQSRSSESSLHLMSAPCTSSKPAPPPPCTSSALFPASAAQRRKLL